MAAGVVEGSDLAVPVPQDDEGIRADRQGDVVAGIPDFAGIAGEQPVCAEDGLQIRLKELFVDIKGLRQAEALPAIGETPSDAILQLHF